MNSHLTELVKAANRERALLKRSRPPAGHVFIYSLYSHKLNMSYIGKTKMSLHIRMNMHRNPSAHCTGTQLFAAGDPDWYILETVPKECGVEREEWHIAHTHKLTNVNTASKPRTARRMRQRLWQREYALKNPEIHRQRSKENTRARNARAVEAGYKNHYQFLKAQREKST